MSDPRRLLMYKNEGVDSEVLRHRREEENVQIRKQKREVEFTKRRNVDETIQDDDVDVTPYTPSDLSNIYDELVKQLFSTNEEDQLNATRNFRKILIQRITNEIHINAVISTNIISRFVEFLQNTNNRNLQYEAAWAITNIASGSSEQTWNVIEANAVPVLIWLIESPHKNIREQVVWALANIAADSPMCRDYVLNMGIMEPLLKFYNSCTTLSMVRNYAWTLSNLCRVKERPTDFTPLYPALPVLVDMLTHSDAEVLVETCWALSHFYDCPNEQIKEVIYDICPILVKLLSHPENNVVSTALHVVGNILTGDEFQTQIIINASVLPCLLSLLGSSKEAIRRKSCWTISNITAGNINQIQAVLNADIFPALMHIMATAEFKTRKEASWAVVNATLGGTREQIQYLIELKCIPTLCNLLTSKDVKFILTVMNGLEKILKLGEHLASSTGAANPYVLLIEDCYGLDKIEFLQSHENVEIYKKALEIIERYFVSDEEDLCVVPPPTPETERMAEQLDLSGQNVSMSGFQF